MKIKNSSFVISAVKKAQYPADELPELAFVGRSNVGKSSIINMLLNRKGLAKTSGTPGKTQLVNFFDIDGLFRFVDLPGYGFAKVSKSVKEGWGIIINEYLSSRQTLLEVVLLLDIRHKPTQDDLNMWGWILQSGFKGMVVCTKADKLSRSAMAKQRAMIARTIGIPAENIIVTSATSRCGKYDFWDAANLLFQSRGYNINLERQSKE